MAVYTVTITSVFECCSSLVYKYYRSSVHRPRGGRNQSTEALEGFRSEAAHAERTRRRDDVYRDGAPAPRPEEHHHRFSQEGSCSFIGCFFWLVFILIYKFLFYILSLNGNFLVHQWASLLISNNYYLQSIIFTLPLPYYTCSILISIHTSHSLKNLKFIELCK